MSETIIGLPAPLSLDRRATEPDVTQLRAAALQRVREMQAAARRAELNQLRDLVEEVAVNPWDTRLERERPYHFRRSSNTAIRSVASIAEGHAKAG